MMTRNHRPALRIGLALGWLLALSAPLLAASNDSYGYVRVLEGSATLTQAGGDRTPAEVNQPVLVGDRLQVPDRSRLEIVLADRNLLRIDGGSELVLEHLAASPDASDRATVLRLLAGNVQLVVTSDSLGEELPRIETPNATIYVQDFGTYRITTDQERWSEVVVRRGKAEVVTDRGSQTVRADEEIYLEGGRWAGAEVEQAGAYDPLERWARTLDQDYQADVRYVDDDLRYRAAPMTRYGSWIYYENRPYWRPRVDAGWRPYWHGRWSWTPSGVTWVSYEPWGWVPYHYGSWDYLPAYGWVWQPGSVWAPAWVYWYWGPSYVGWCPTGYYTRYYGPRFGVGFGFHFGVYGWAGGDWGRFDRWTFVSSNYFRGYRQGYRDGFRDGRWDGWRDHWDVRRYAVPRDQMQGRGPLERGIVTTDTRPIPPDTWNDPRQVVRVLHDQPTARRTGGGELPDVTPFVARNPDLPPTVRTVVSERNPRGLEGTPLRPDTLGPQGRSGGETPRVAREAPRPQTEGERPSVQPRQPGQPGVTTGGRPGTPEGGRTPRMARPLPQDDGGAPRPGGGIRAVPRDSDRGEPRGVGSGREPDRPAGRRIETPERPSTRETPRPREIVRPDPGDDGGAPRPGGSIRAVPRDADRTAPRSRREEPEPPATRRMAPEPVRPSNDGRERGAERPEPPEPYAERPRSERPEPRVITPRVYERPDPPASSGDRGRVEPRVYERRPEPPASTRERSGSNEPRVQAPPSRSESRGSARSAPERPRREAARSSEGSRGSGGERRRRPPGA